MSSDIATAMADLERNVSRRSETDRIMSFPVWFILWIITLGIAGIIMWFFLIERRDQHFKRQTRVVEGIETILKAHAEKNQEIGSESAKISSIVKEVKDEEGERSAILWVIVTMLTGITGFYVMYFLTTDVFKHFKRQNEFIVEYISAVGKLGGDTSSLMNLTKTQYPVPERSFVLYLVLSIITLGFFGIYWLYVIFKDWNNHFQSQWAAEDQILASIRNLPAPDSKPKKKAVK